MAQPVSTEWRSSLGKSRHQIVRLDVMTRLGQPIWTTNPAIVNPISVTAASFTRDMGRSVRGNATATLSVIGDVDAARLIPSSPTHPLSPLAGTQVQLWSGFRWVSGDEVVPVGRFYIHQSEAIETAAGVTIDLTMQDLAGRLDVADYVFVETIARGTNVVDAIKQVVAPVLPALTWVTVATKHTTPQITVDDMTNRLTLIEKLASSAGLEFFIDPLGRGIVRVIPSTLDSPAWVFEGGTVTPLTSATNNLTDETVYNIVRARGENMSADDTPVQAYAWDNDPTSATYFDPLKPELSNVGPRPFFMTSEFMITEAQCQDAADGALRKHSGLVQRVQITTVNNPAVNEGDVIRVERPTVGIGGTFVVERVSGGLETDEMTLICQDRRL